MASQIEENKAVVLRFNKEVIEMGSLESFKELMNDDFVNHTAPPGVSKGPDGMIHTFENILRPALSDLKVTIFDQVAEGDMVTTRKAITGIHTGPFLGVAATGKTVTINVMDMVRIRNGQYFEHWGMNNILATVQQLAKQD